MPTALAAKTKMLLITSTDAGWRKTSSELTTYNVSNADYFGSEDLIETWIAAQESKSFAKEPFKVKAFRDIQPQVVERIGELIAAEAGAVVTDGAGQAMVFNSPAGMQDGVIVAPGTGIVPSGSWPTSVQSS